jgi:hypothetical protein
MKEYKRNETVLKGIIIGLENMGAKFIKIDETHMFIEIIKEGELDDEDKLSRTKTILTKMFNLGLKVKRV